MTASSVGNAEEIRPGFTVSLPLLPGKRRVKYRKNCGLFTPAYPCHRLLQVGLMIKSHTIKHFKYFKFNGNTFFLKNTNSRQVLLRLELIHFCLLLFSIFFRQLNSKFANPSVSTSTSLFHWQEPN